MSPANQNIGHIARECWPPSIKTRLFICKLFSGDNARRQSMWSARGAPAYVCMLRALINFLWKFTFSLRNRFVSTRGDNRPRDDKSRVEKFICGEQQKNTPNTHDSAVHNVLWNSAGNRSWFWSHHVPITPSFGGAEPPKIRRKEKRKKSLVDDKEEFALLARRHHEQIYFGRWVAWRVAKCDRR